MSRVVATLDSQHRNDLVFLERMFARIERLQKKRSLSRDEERVLRILEAPPPRFGEERTRSLPPSLTDDVPCILAEVPIEHSYLPHGLPPYLHYREANLLPCRVDNVPNGRVVLLPFSWGQLHEREEYFLRNVERTGARLSAARVQANYMLYERQRLSLPGLVLVTFEPDEVVSKLRLIELAEDIYDLKERRPKNRDEEEVRDIVMASEQKGILYRRRLLPRGYTGGPEIYASDLFFRPHYLRHRCLTDDDILIPVVAERGPKGAIEHVPYWEFTGETAPAPDEIAEAIPADGGPLKIYASRRSVTSGAAATAEAIQTVAPSGGNWIDVTDEVLPETAEEVEAVQAQPVTARRVAARRSRGPMFAVILLAAVAIVGAGGAAVRYFGFRTPELLRLSNPRVAGMGLQKTAIVDYQVKEQPDTGYRYFAILRDRQTGFTQQFAISFPSDSRGEINLVLPFRPLMPMGRVNDFDIYVEREKSERPGKRERVSNSVLLRY